MHRWCLLNHTVQGFSLNLTVRGVSNKHCLLTFFIFIGFVTIVPPRSNDHVYKKKMISYGKSIVRHG